jgi:hypothetical protein
MPKDKSGRLNIQVLLVVKAMIEVILMRRAVLRTSNQTHRHTPLV